jgi:hypothetical protein
MSLAAIHPLQAETLEAPEYNMPKSVSDCCSWKLFCSRHIPKCNLLHSQFALEQTLSRSQDPMHLHEAGGSPLRGDHRAART